MIKFIFLMIFFLIGSHPLKAQDTLEKDQDFVKGLDQAKDPFEDGIPKPVVIIQEPVHQEVPQPVISPKPVIRLKITLPAMDLQGVMVGDEMHEAIIDDQIVPLLGFIKGAQVIAVAKEGVELLFKGKKFFLKVD